MVSKTTRRLHAWITNHLPHADVEKTLEISIPVVWGSPDTRNNDDWIVSLLANTTQVEKGQMMEDLITIIESQDLVEVKLARVWKHATSKKRPVAILTAFRGEFDTKTNIKRNKQMASEIRSAGYGYFFVDGQFIENQGTPEEVKVKEDSIFVVGKENDSGNLKSLIKKLGNKYNQDAVLYKPEATDVAMLIFKDGSEDNIGKFKVKSAADFLTMLKKGKGSFVFEDIRTNPNYFTRYWEGRKSFNEFVG
jgi:hypothetical protein